MKTTSIRKNERGQSLVELSMVLLVVLVILAGVVDLGHMMYVYLTMRDAAQEGAGYGALYPGYCNQISARVRDNLPGADFAVAVTVNGLSCSAAFSADAAAAASGLLPANACSGKDLTITLDHNYPVSMPLIGSFIDPQGDGVPMHVQISDRITRPECRK